MTSDDVRPGDLFAFYGSLRRGLPTLVRLGIAKRLHHLSDCIISGTLFDLGDFPGLIEGEGTVAGDLFRLSDVRAVQALDRFEGFDQRRADHSHFVRKKVRLIRPDELAWVYFYNGATTGRQKVPEGDWIAHKGPIGLRP